MPPATRCCRRCRAPSWSPEQSSGRFQFNSQPFRASLQISLPIFTGFNRNLGVARANAAREDADEAVPRPPAPGAERRPGAVPGPAGGLPGHRGAGVQPEGGAGAAAAGAGAVPAGQRQRARGHRRPDRRAARRRRITSMRSTPITRPSRRSSTPSAVHFAEQGLTPCHVAPRLGCSSAWLVAVIGGDLVLSGGPQKRQGHRGPARGGRDAGPGRHRHRQREDRGQDQGGRQRRHHRPDHRAQRSRKGTWSRRASSWSRSTRRSTSRSSSRAEALLSDQRGHAAAGPGQPGPGQAPLDRALGAPQGEPEPDRRGDGRAGPAGL